MKTTLNKSLETTSKNNARRKLTNLLLVLTFVVSTAGCVMQDQNTGYERQTREQGACDRTTLVETWSEGELIATQLMTVCGEAIEGHPKMWAQGYGPNAENDQ